MVVLNVKYTLKPGQREGFLQAIKEANVAEQVRGEAGNRQYDYLLPVDENDVDSLYLLEEYIDMDALESHKNEAHFAALQKMKEEYVRDTEIRIFEK